MHQGSDGDGDDYDDRPAGAHDDGAGGGRTHALYAATVGLLRLLTMRSREDETSKKKEKVVDIIFSMCGRHKGTMEWSVHPLFIPYYCSIRVTAVVDGPGYI